MKPLIQLFALFSLLTVTREADVIGSHDTVKWVDGEDPTLTCDLKKPFNMTTLSVLWERNGTIVHLYRTMADYLVDQDKNFVGRTSLFPDELAKGTFSLTLTNVTELDAGNYTCKGRVKDLSGKGLVRQCNVTLIVERKQSKGNPTKSPRIEDNKDTVISLSVIIPIVFVIVIGIGIYIWNKYIKKETAPEPQNDLSPSPRRRRRFRKKRKEKNNPEEISLKSTST